MEYSCYRSIDASKIHLWGHLPWQWRKNCSGIAGWLCRLLLQIALACLHSPVLKLGYPRWNGPPGPLHCDKKPESTATCSWNLTKNKGIKWDFLSKVKSLELKVTPQQRTGCQKEREIINYELGWLMLSGRVQSFEDELKISCGSWICENILGQMLLLLISVTKIPLEGGWPSSVENNTLSSTALFAGSRLECYSILTDDSWGHGGV